MTLGANDYLWVRSMSSFLKKNDDGSFRANGSILHPILLPYKKYDLILRDLYSYFVDYNIPIN
jgi:hypothetical protein